MKKLPAKRTHRAHKKIFHWKPLCAIALCAIVMAVLYYPVPRVNAPTSSEATSLNDTSVSPMASNEAQDPLLISSIRSKNYPGSALTVEQSVGAYSDYSTQVVSYLSDGLKIRALVSTPGGASPTQGWPVVIFNHGYIEPSTYSTTGPEYTEFIAALSRAGYVVIKPDFRGHGQSEGEPSGGHFSPAYAYDELNLIASIKQDKQYDASRIGIVGHSMGGHVALRTIVVSQDVKATVMLAGVVGSFTDIFYNWPNSPMPRDLPAKVQSIKRSYIDRYGDPRTNNGFWDGASAINYVKDVRGQIQVQHSTDDSTVPYAFSSHLATALRNAGKSVDVKTYGGNDHQFSANRSATLQNMVSFFQSHL